VRAFRGRSLFWWVVFVIACWWFAIAVIVFGGEVLVRL